MSGLGTAKSESHRKTRKVEPDGTGRKYMFLPGEISRVRAREKSAEAVVALMPVERREERRAKVSREDSISCSCSWLRAGSRHGKARQLRSPPTRPAKAARVDSRAKLAGDYRVTGCGARQSDEGQWRKTANR